VEQALNIAIVFLSFSVLVFFKRTRSYLSIGGLSLIVSVLVLFFLKYLTIGNLSEIGFRTDNISATIIPTSIYLALSVAILFTMRYKPKKFKAFRWIFALIFLYLVFGFLLQFFFQAIFTHTINKLVDEKILVILFSSVFFSSFHWGWDSKGIKFGLMTLFGGIVMSTLFLTSPNIYVLGITHGILASFYYFIVYEGNILEKRIHPNVKRSILGIIHH